MSKLLNINISIEACPDDIEKYMKIENNELPGQDPPASDYVGLNVRNINIYIKRKYKCKIS